MIDKLAKIRLLDLLSFTLACIVILLFNIPPIIPVLSALIFSLANKFIIYNSIQNKSKANDLLLFGVKSKKNRNHRIIIGVSGIIVSASALLYVFKSPNEIYWWLFGGMALTGTIETLFSVSKWTVIIEDNKLYARSYNLFPIELSSKLKMKKITDSKIELSIGEWTHCIHFDSEEMNRLEEVIARY